MELQNAAEHDVDWDEDNEHTRLTPRTHRWSRWRLVRFVQHEPVLALTVLGVILGSFFGGLARLAEPSDTAIMLVSFPGEMLLRGLKMMVIPLICGSMIAGVCSLRSSGASMGAVARRTLLLYAVSTAAAMMQGVILVNIFRPGVGRSNASGGCHEENPAEDVDPVTPLDSVLNVARGAVPPNVVEAAADGNILGLILFSLFFGVMLVSMGRRADSIIHGIETFNEVIMKMVNLIILTTPFGVMSLIAGKILEACDLSSLIATLGLYIFTVEVGLLLHGCIVLPLGYFFLTRKNPLSFAKGMTLSLVTVFGTSSSVATLPVTMRCCEENNGLHPQTCKFVLPLGATVNMNGTALYEAVAVIFIAQLNGVELSLGGMLVVGLTSTLAAVGAAAIPSAGLVTMVMVLQAAGLQRFVGDIGLILAVDWFLDRCRTVINVLGDAYVAGVVDKLVVDGEHAREAQPLAMSDSEAGRRGSADSQEVRAV